jgi:hypothetical protein
VPWLYRSTSLADDDFAPIQQIVIIGGPNGCIDFTAMPLANGTWIAVAADYSAPPAESLFFMTATTRLGPYTVQARSGTVFGVEGNEAPQLRLLPGGGVRLIYDRFRDSSGLHYIDSTDLFVTHTAPALMTSGPFYNRAGALVSFPTRHGDIV